jgi:hypothetical protein
VVGEVQTPEDAIQAPEEQAWPALQTLPQAPQLEVSETRFEQMVPQEVVGQE